MIMAGVTDGSQVVGVVVLDPDLFSGLFIRVPGFDVMNDQQPGCPVVFRLQFLECYSA